MNNRQLAWTYICRLHHKKTFTAQKLGAATGMTLTSAKHYIKRLEKEKRIEATGRLEEYTHDVYRVISKRPIPGYGPWHRKKAPVRQRLWSSMRIMKRFNIIDLQITAMAGKHTTQSYLRALVKAKLVRQQSTPDGVVYRLNIDLGPQHPIVKGDHVYCQNSQIKYPFTEEKS